MSNTVIAVACSIYGNATQVLKPILLKQNEKRKTGRKISVDSIGRFNIFDNATSFIR